MEERWGQSLPSSIKYRHVHTSTQTKTQSGQLSVCFLVESSWLLAVTPQGAKQGMHQAAFNVVSLQIVLNYQIILVGLSNDALIQCTAQ